MFTLQVWIEHIPYPQKQNSTFLSNNFDILQWGATPLIDNKEDFEKTYLISVYTGVRQNGGTKSRIRFILSGEYSDTGIRRLEDATGKRVSNHCCTTYLLWNSFFEITRLQ